MDVDDIDELERIERLLNIVNGVGTKHPPLAPIQNRAMEELISIAQSITEAQRAAVAGPAPTTLTQAESEPADTARRA